MKRWLILLLLSVFPLALHANEAKPLAEDEVVEQRLIKIAQDLRCLVCQNESLAGSRADLAEDLRQEIREQIRQGKTDQEVVDYMVSRYGDFVRYRPPVKPTTWLLWFGPFLLLAASVGTLVIVLRRRNRVNAEAPLTREQKQLAEALLRDKT
jgi:cytochrome c-type biogenesis protein CcmH